MIGREGDALAEPPALPSESLAWAAAELVAIYDQPGFRLNAAPQSTSWLLIDGEPVQTELVHGGVPAPRRSTRLSALGWTWDIAPWRQDGVQGAGGGTGAILSPMPGKVIAVEVAAGQTVTAGQKLLTLEAMKMEHGLSLIHI